MSVAKGSLYSEVSCLGGGRAGGPCSVWAHVQEERRGSLYSKVQCFMDSGYMGPVPVGRMTDGQSRMKTLPSCNFVGGR